MDLRNNDGENDDPTARRWLDPGAFADRDREIWRLRADGQHTIGSIAAAVGCGVASVHRALERLAKSQRQSSPQRNALPSLESELGAELDAVLARYDDGGMAAGDVRTADDVDGLNELEWHRLRHLPDDHSARAGVGGVGA
jgi:DNA-binding CsgD family transcriptional regulator